MVNVESRMRGFEMSVVGEMPTPEDFVDEDFAQGYYGYIVSAKARYEGLDTEDLTDEERGNLQFMKALYRMAGLIIVLSGGREITAEECNHEYMASGIIGGLGVKLAIEQKELNLLEQSMPFLMQGYFALKGLLMGVQNQELTLTEQLNENIALGYRSVRILLDKGQDWATDELLNLIVLNNSLSHGSIR